MHLPCELSNRAAGQHALLTTDDFGASSFDGNAIRRLVDAGIVRRERHRVYAVAGAPRTWEQSVLAAVLGGGEGCAASHATAAALWQFPRARRDGLAVSVPLRRRPRLDGVHVHRSASLDASDLATVSGIPVVIGARALVEWAPTQRLGVVARALDDGIVRRILTVELVGSTIERLRPAPGRRLVELRLLVEERLGASEAGESIPENRLYRWLVGAGLPVPVPQFPVEVDGLRYRVDLAYPEERIAIEYDGFDPHRTRSAVDSGMVRDRELLARGWTPLHFGSRSSESEVVRDVTRALAASGRPVPQRDTQRPDVA